MKSTHIACVGKARAILYIAPTVVPFHLNFFQFQIKTKEDVMIVSSENGRKFRGPRKKLHVLLHFLTPRSRRERGNRNCFPSTTQGKKT